MLHAGTVNARACYAVEGQSMNWNHGKSWVSREIRVKISLKTKSHWPLQSAEPKFDTPVSWVR